MTASQDLIAKIQSPIRVVRANEINWQTNLLPDSKLPNMARDVAIIASPAPPLPFLAPHVQIDCGMNVSLMRIPPGATAGLHDHDSVEIFLPLDGPLVMIIGHDPAEEIVLGMRDWGIVPAGRLRSFRNDSSMHVEVLTLVQEPTHVGFHSSVMAMMTERGLVGDKLALDQTDG